MMILAAIFALALGVSAQVGPSGIVSPDGKNIQFTHDFANDIAVVGPSGIVTKSGKNMQLSAGQAMLNLPQAFALQPAAPVAEALFKSLPLGSVVGASGIVNPDGNNVQFSQAQADDIVLVGPSGIVTRSGQNIQLRAKRNAGFVLPAGNLGRSGILRKDGSTNLFSHDFAHDIALIGPSGIVTKSGKNYQLTDDLNIVGWESVDPLAQVYSAKPGVTIALEGPSGYIMSDGTPIQKRAKRALIGPSGLITPDGQQIQFSKEGVTILLEGPSGYILSDGTAIQKRSKRNIVGSSGIVTRDGRLIQFPAGVSVVVAGPSGVVLSNGQNIQL